MKQFIPEEISLNLNTERANFWFLLEKHLPKVKQVMRRRLKTFGFNQTDSEDIQQNTFIEMLSLSEEKIRLLKQEDDLVYYAIRVARNKAIDYLRRRKLEQNIFVETDFDNECSLNKSSNAQKELETISLATKIWNEIRQLTFRQRVAIILNKKSDELINFIVRKNLTEQLCEALNCDFEGVNEVLRQFPLKDCEIALFYEKKIGVICSSKMIQDARYYGLQKIEQERCNFS